MTLGGGSGREAVGFGGIVSFLNPIQQYYAIFYIPGSSSTGRPDILDKAPARWCVHFEQVFSILRFVISNAAFDHQVCGGDPPPPSNRCRRRCPCFCAPSRQSQIPSPSFSGRCPWCRRRWSQSVSWRRMCGRQKSGEATASVLELESRFWFNRHQTRGASGAGKEPMTFDTRTRRCQLRGLRGRLHRLGAQRAHAVFATLKVYSRPHGRCDTQTAKRCREKLKNVYLK